MGLDMGADLELFHSIAMFYADEAALLDDRALVEWADLFTETAAYELFGLEKRQLQRSKKASVVNPSILLFRDDKAFLQLRARRILETTLAHAERPPSASRQLITNIRILDDDGDTIGVRSSFVTHQARLDFDEFTFFGRRLDRLRRVPEGFRIERRTVHLDQFILARSLTILF